MHLKIEYLTIIKSESLRLDYGIARFPSPEVQIAFAN